MGKTPSPLPPATGQKKKDGSLANVFEAFRNVPEVSGAPYRLLDRSKPVAAILAIAGLVISLLFGRSGVKHSALASLLEPPRSPSLWQSIDKR